MLAVAAAQANTAGSDDKPAGFGAWERGRARGLLWQFLGADVRFKKDVVIPLVVAVVVVGGGAAAYGLTAGSKPAANITNADGQTQNCVSKTGVLYVTSAAVKKCPKGMTPAQGGAGPSSAAPSASASPRSSAPKKARARHAPRPKPTHSQTPAPTHTSSPPTSHPAPSPTTQAPPPAVGSGSYDCNFQTDTWSGDASSVGYSVQELSASNGKAANFSVKLNANKGTTEVVGYPSDQCLIYTALPGTLTSSFHVTPPGSSSGLDYEYAYDIWLTTTSAASSNNWNNDLELMIWTYVHGQVPAGSKVSKLSDGSAVWFAGTKGDNNSTVSVVLPSSSTSGSVNISSIVSQLKSLGYVPSSDTGILDVEYGIEAPYGGGNTFAVNGFSVSG
jgi:Glycosyl hydrolase family 12